METKLSLTMLFFTVIIVIAIYGLVPQLDRIEGKLDAILEREHVEWEAE